MRKIRKVFILLWFPVIFCCFFIEQVFSMNDTHSWTFAQKAMGQNYSSGQLMTYTVPEEYPLEGSQKFNVSVNGYYTCIYNDNNLYLIAVRSIHLRYYQKDLIYKPKKYLITLYLSRLVT